jgi:hypothetical protein
LDNLFFQTFTLIGLTFILKYGSILNPVRDYLTNNPPLLSGVFFTKLFKCALCLGVWVGLFFGCFYEGFFISWALYSAAVCWIADHAIMIAQKHLYPTQPSSADGISDNAEAS